MSVLPFPPYKVTGQNFFCPFLISPVYHLQHSDSIEPYNVDEFLFSGNIFLELVNFFDIPNLDFGLLEKVYQFVIQDCVINEITEKADLVPITDITLLLENYGYNLIEVSK